MRLGALASCPCASHLRARSGLPASKRSPPRPTQNRLSPSRLGALASCPCARQNCCEERGTTREIDASGCSTALRFVLGDISRAGGTRQLIAKAPHTIDRSGSVCLPTRAHRRWLRRSVAGEIVVVWGGSEDVSVTPRPGRFRLLGSSEGGRADAASTPTRPVGRESPSGRPARRSGLRAGVNEAIARVMAVYRRLSEAVQAVLCTP